MLLTLQRLAARKPHFFKHAMTIRLRLTLWYTALLGATLILFSGVVYSALATNLRQQLLQETARQATEISKAVTQQLQGNFLVISDLSSLYLPKVNVDAFANTLPVQIIDLQGRNLLKSQWLEATGLTVPNHTGVLPAIRQKQGHIYYFPYNSDGA